MKLEVACSAWMCVHQAPSAKKYSRGIDEYYRTAGYKLKGHENNRKLICRIQRATPQYGGRGRGGRAPTAGACQPSIYSIRTILYTNIFQYIYFVCSCIIYLSIHKNKQLNKKHEPRNIKLFVSNKNALELLLRAVLLLQPGSPPALRTCLHSTHTYSYCKSFHSQSRA